MTARRGEGGRVVDSNNARWFIIIVSCINSSLDKFIFFWNFTPLHSLAFLLLVSFLFMYRRRPEMCFLPDPFHNRKAVTDTTERTTKLNDRLLNEIPPRADNVCQCEHFSCFYFHSSKEIRAGREHTSIYSLSADDEMIYYFSIHSWISPKGGERKRKEEEAFFV